MVEFTGRGAPLTQAAINSVVNILQCEKASLWALITVETRGFGFQQDRRPKILFERHIFHKRTNGQFSASHPDISASTSGGYGAESTQYARLTQAMALDEQAALESASWGLGQVMGFNASLCGYPSVEAMIARFAAGEDEQLSAIAKFISANAALHKAFRDRNWPTVASVYNGPNYATHGYDKKLAYYHTSYTQGHYPDIRVRAAQAYLTYLHYAPGGVDGLMGSRTKQALTDYQKARGLPKSGSLDQETEARLINDALH